MLTYMLYWWSRPTAGHTRYKYILNKGWAARPTAPLRRTTSFPSFPRAFLDRDFPWYVVSYFPRKGFRGRLPQAFLCCYRKWQENFPKVLGESPGKALRIVMNSRRPFTLFGIPGCDSGSPPPPPQRGTKRTRSAAKKAP